MAKAREPALALTIERLGARGDGIAFMDGTPIFVAGALPRERVHAVITGERGHGFAARLEAILHEQGRAAPACQHFGVCGGCVAQHMDQPTYASWRRTTVVDALTRARLAVPEASDGPVLTPPGARRRVRLHFTRRGGLGYRKRASHAVLTPQACPLIRPELDALLRPLATCLQALPLAATGLDVALTSTRSGVDLLLIGGRAPGLSDRETLSAFADAQDLARIAWAAKPAQVPEPIVMRRSPVVDVGGIRVGLPPGAFLQASLEAEQALRARVHDALAGRTRVLDLFTGIGTFALPLARAGHRVTAYERDASMIDALNGAARLHGLNDRVSGHVRDLERAPLHKDELAACDAVLLDPPRAGAGPMCQMLAASGPPLVVMVSCHVGSFARDGATLAESGYRLTGLSIVDAFLWSDQLELVAVFERA